MNDSTNFTSTTAVSTYFVSLESALQLIIFYIIGGTIAIIGNVLIIVLIIKNIKLHTFFYAIISGHMIGRTLISIYNVTNAAFRLIAHFYPYIIVLTKLECHLLNVLNYFCQSFTAVTMLILAVDRTFSLLLPAFYHKYRMKRGILITIAAACLTVILKIVPSFVGIPGLMSDKVLCETGRGAVSSVWWDYNYYSNLVLVFLGVLMYIILFVVTFLKKKSILQKVSAVDNEITVEMNPFIKTQEKLLEIVRLLIIVNVFTVVLSSIFAIAATYVVYDIRWRFVTYGTCLMVFERILDPVILLWKSSIIRDSFKQAIGKSSNVVTMSLT